MKKQIFIIFLLLGSMLPFVEAASISNCEANLGMACSSGKVPVFYMNPATANAHVSDINHPPGASICCSLNNINVGIGGCVPGDTRCAFFFRASATSNAHTERNDFATPTYDFYDYYIKTTDGSTLSCSYKDFGQACSSGTTCVIKMSSSTNAHVASCAYAGGEYLTSVCCGASVTQTCGNGIIEGTEQCDGSALGGATCSSLGFSSGALSCYAPGTAQQCQFDTSQCQITPGPGVCILDTAHWADSGCNTMIDGVSVRQGTSVCLKATGTNCDSTDTVIFTIKKSSDRSTVTSTSSSFSGETATQTWATTSVDLNTYFFEAHIASPAQTKTSGDLTITDQTHCGNGVREAGESCDYQANPNGCSLGQICGSPPDLPAFQCQCGTLQGTDIISFRLAGECRGNSNDVYGTRDIRVVTKDVSRGSIISDVTTTEDCILGENVPFFTGRNVFIVILLLIGFYSYQGSKSFKYKKKLKERN